MTILIVSGNGLGDRLKVDADGGDNNFVAIAALEAITGITDEANLETNGYLIDT